MNTNRSIRRRTWLTVVEQRGFTIIELLVALSVLSVLLVITSVTMLQIGKLYAKGINAANVQNAARNVMADVTGVLQFGGSLPTPCSILYPPVTTSTGAVVDGKPTCAANHMTRSVAWGGTVDIYSYCVNTTRYSYILDKQIDSNPAPGQTYYALWRDIMNNNASCNPLDLSVQNAGGPSDASTEPGSGSEQIPPHMTLTSFFVSETPTDSGLYTINVGLAYGDHDLLIIDPTNGNVACAGGTGQQYCGISSLETLVTRRLK